MSANDSGKSLSEGGTFAEQPKVDREDVSLGDAATFPGSAKRRAADLSLGDERTFSGPLDDQETVIDGIETYDLAERYKTESTLGRGGMGEVLLALDTRLDRKVAIKRILGEAARSKTAISRFLTEAKAIARLNHPNIVQIYDQGRAKDGPFLIMEYVDGSSLLDRCRDGALPLEEAVDLACQLCDGLGKAHDMGIVHRDIKPANVLLTKEGLPKLTDFGLAKVEAADHQMTMTGAVLGTPDFMPPEQRRDASLVDARSDLWSLAATLYQMVTGRSPKIIRFDLLPAGLTEVLGKALEEAKEDRYQTARELRDALKASVSSTAPAAATLSAGQCRSCSVQNDSSRRYCRGCGKSLEAPCLSCSTLMPMWEEICGQCGTKQGPLLEERRRDMAARQAEAESVLKDHDFERAEGIAVALRDESDTRLKDLGPWATAFLPKIAAARDAQLAEAANRLAEARKHEASFDYPSAITALQHVPDILRVRPLEGQAETVASALARLSDKQAEVERLEFLVKDRIAARELSGLLAEAEKLRALRPDRHDLQKLCTQLEERQRKLIAQRDEALATARSHLEAKEYEAGLAALRKIDRTVETREVERLRATTDATLRQLQSMIATIKDAVAEKRLDGLIVQVEAALTLKPSDPDLVKLLEGLQAREAKIASGVADVVAQAEHAFRACHFDKAAAALQRIPKGRLTAELASQIDRYTDLATTQSWVTEEFTNLPKVPDLATAAGVDLSGAAARGRAYLAQIAEHGLADAAIEQWCITCEAAAARHAATEAAERARKEASQRIFRIAVVAVAALAILGGGIAIRSSMQGAALKTALAKGDWQAALASDPTNLRAILGLAKLKLAVQPPDIAGALEQLARAERINPASAELQATRAEAYAARAVDHATNGRLTEACEDFEKAKHFNGSDQSLKMARDAIGAAWQTQAIEDAEADRLEGAASALRQANRFAGDALTIQPAEAAIASGWLARAIKHAEAGRLDEANTALNHARQLSVTTQTLGPALKALSDAWLTRARQHAQENRLQDASDALNRARGFSADETSTQAVDEQVAAAWTERVKEATLKRTPSAVKTIGDLARKAGFGQQQLLAIWSASASQSVAAMDAECLSLACGEGKSLGMPQSQVADLWIQFAGKAVASPNADVPAALAALEAATAAGAKPQETGPLRARTMMLEAGSLASNGQTERAVAAFAEALQLDAAIVEQSLGGASLAELRKAVEADYRSRFDAAVVSNNWETALQLSVAARMVDENSSEWIRESIVQNPAGLSALSINALKRLPPSVLANLPAATVASLPLATIAKLPPDLVTALPHAVIASSSPAAVAALPADTVLKIPPLRNSIGIQLKLLPAGTFTMGQEGEGVFNGPHQVTLKKAFFIGVHEITNAQWKQVMGDVPSRWKEADRPVECVTWEAAVEFCKRLSALPAEKADRLVYRLPTEAEWEYACRAGTNTRYFFDEGEWLGHYAWFDGNSHNETHPVGQKKPNPWGLFDMYGNVGEWCNDWYGDYGVRDISDPLGPARGNYRIDRGGCWFSGRENCQSATRLRFDPSSRSDSPSTLGLRIVLSLSGAQTPTATQQ